MASSLSVLFLVGTIAIAPQAGGASSSPPDREATANLAPDGWVTGFYLQPRADLAPQMIARLDQDGTLGNADAAAPLSAFLSILARRPDVPLERLAASERLSSAGRATLLDALWLAGQGKVAVRIARARAIAPDRWARPAPTLLSMELTGKTLIEMEYLEYRRDLPPRMELFAPPAGVEITQQD